jgi:glycosyltransferase involved in cell wall biosynthesis
MKFSIITPSLNQCAFLQRTARSILDQTGPFDLEWLILDGGSTDGTLDFLKSLNDPRINWRSEKDAGQAAAINKGFALATGDVLAWLNSDDLYLPDALSAVALAFADNPRAQWLVGRCKIIDEHDAEIRPWITRYKNRRLNRYSHRRLLRENFIPQPAVFFRRDFLSHSAFRIQNSEFLDSSLHYTMDYDLWLRMARISPPLILPQTLAAFRLHDQSKSGRFNREQFDEGFQVAQRYFNGDKIARLSHKVHVEKIVWTYRLLRLVGL